MLGARCQMPDARQCQIRSHGGSWMIGFPELMDEHRESGSPAEQSCECRAESGRAHV